MIQGAWDRPTYKYGTEPKDPFKSSLNPGPGSYNVQLDRTGNLTFGKKKPAVAGSPPEKKPVLGSKLVGKGSKLFKS